MRQHSAAVHRLFCSTGASSDTLTWDGPNRSLWLGRLQSEIDNIRAALTEAHARGDVEALLQLTAALWQFWVVQGYLGEGREWIQIALNASGDHADLRVLRARVTEGAGVLALHQQRLCAGAARFQRVPRSVPSAGRPAVQIGRGALLSRHSGMVSRRLPPSNHLLRAKLAMLPISRPYIRGLHEH